MESVLHLLLYPLTRLWDVLQELRGRWPTERRKAALINAPKVRAARAAELERIQGLVAALGAVEGVEHLLTQVRDFSVPPRAVLDRTRLSDADALLICRIHARAYYVVREPVTDVLPRIEAADVTEWRARDQRPSAGGSVEHALRWYRDGGLTPEGRRMDSPGLDSAVARLSWDRPDIPCPDPEPKRPYPTARFTLDQTPPDADAAQLLREARADGRGVVLELVVGKDGRAYSEYHVVPRGGLLGRGRL
ncbi:hypothetical protein ACFZDG_38600 [Kitasatospora xanthocidica]|uniref:hypothetical protein n=1 Tax=Kitasatospora xanthocidica TaxID=83382 RepID=UPI0036E6CEA1